jgi:hypothetical protein
MLIARGRCDGVPSLSMGLVGEHLKRGIRVHDDDSTTNCRCFARSYVLFRSLEVTSGKSKVVMDEQRIKAAAY